MKGFYVFTQVLKQPSVVCSIIVLEFKFGALQNNQPKKGAAVSKSFRIPALAFNSIIYVVFISSYRKLDAVFLNRGRRVVLFL